MSAENEKVKKIIKKNLKEEIYNFFEDPTRVTFRDLIKNNVGEFDILDFKEAFPTFSKLARTILAMGNRESGCLIMGMKEEKDGTLKPVGLEKLIDKADITKGIQAYIPKKLKDDVEILDFSFEDAEYKKLIGKKFQIIFVVQKSEYLPYVSMIGNGEDIKADTIYFRRGTESTQANYEELQEIINKRIETKYSSSRELSLKNHLEQLKTLYAEIPKTISFSPFFSNLALAIPQVLLGEVKLNPEYPKESYSEFIIKMVKEKKNIITKELALEEINKVH